MTASIYLTSKRRFRGLYNVYVGNVPEAITPEIVDDFHSMVLDDQIMNLYWIVQSVGPSCVRRHIKFFIYNEIGTTNKSCHA